MENINLENTAKIARENLLSWLERRRGGHFGTCLSSIELFLVLLNIKKACPKKNLVLSKGHAWGGLLSCLYAINPTNIQISSKFNMSGLQNHHPDYLEGFVRFTTGSLGHGIGLATGIALVTKDQIKVEDRNVYVYCGDGELNEGSCWESVLASSALNLDNLFIIVDRNQLQNSNNTEIICPLDDLRNKFESFNATVEICNGHSFNDIAIKLDELEKSKSGPKVLICNTVKGKGVKCIENDPRWHFKTNLNASDFSKLRDSLNHGKK